MSTVAPTSLMTVEEFDKLPEPRGGYYELRHGEPILVTFPRMRQARLQARLQRLLMPRLPQSIVTMELAFRPSPEHELWRADLAAVSLQRWEETSPDGWLAGSPELVIEVVSPSNTSEEMDDREQTVLRGGANEFWVVYPAREQVRVATSDGRVRRYGKGDRIPVGEDAVPVDEIFVG